MNGTRRQLLVTGAGLGASLLIRPAHATSAELEATLKAHTGGAPLREGKVKIEMDLLVENGNAVPITVSVASPMSAADHVKSIAVFNERNPQREVAQFTLSPRSGRASVATRIRLSTSQKLVAVAQLSDNSFWSHSVEVIVTLAGCVEE
jgi:sulfur-oxidizing protein SoxY